jgi:hypothetical protein
MSDALLDEDVLQVKITNSPLYGLLLTVYFAITLLSQVVDSTGEAWPGVGKTLEKLRRVVGKPCNFAVHI